MFRMIGTLRKRMRIPNSTFLILNSLVLLITAAHAAGAEHTGQVTFGGVPVPGATVTASHGERKVIASTDEHGVYHITDLTDGTWSVRVEMLGFAPTNRDVTVAAGESPVIWELTLLPFAEITRGVETRASSTFGPKATPGAQSATAGFVRAEVAPAAYTPTTRTTDQNLPTDQVSGEGGLGAEDGFLINGSVNNGAASPFAQLRAFGNNRPGQRSLYNGGVGLLAGHSSWDARPYSFSGEQTAKPTYSDLHFLASFGGPLRIPGLIRNGANVFVGYQRISDHNASTQSAVMPTLLEREGDFSRSRDSFGRPISITDPTTGRPFAGNVMPPDRISPQAAALLGYYPAPNLDEAGRFNYQSPVLNFTRQDNVQSRVTQPLNTRNQLFGTFAYQRTIADTTNIFGFEDAREVSGIDAAANWSHRFSQFLSLRLRYQHTRLTTRVTPYFSGLTNVSGAAGISGNDQSPENWGPPGLTFSSGLTGLSDGIYNFTTNHTNGWSAESVLGGGRHNITVGGGVRRHHIDILSQQDPRGSFAFNGFASGSDLADFLLGIPRSSTIAFGNPDKYLRAFSYDTFVSDDWRVSPSLTVNAGVRWEYEAPPTERFSRLVNLDIAPGFSAVAPVVADHPVGRLTGERYPTSLLRPDRGGIQPRVATAWRPIAGSSLVIRAGYGVYRNTSVYQSIATLLAQQPPLSTTLSVENTASNPLTLARGFVASPGLAANTFAVDPEFRVGYAHNWQLSVQRDFPGSLNLMVTYLGTKGSRLMQQVMPNTYPAGSTNPCLSCPAGFVYLTSNGNSSRHAGQFQLRRRLRNGLTATTQYTLAKAQDDAAAFGGASLAGAAVAQNWLDLDAEYGPSNFDQRHLLTAQFEYTTGIGVRGGALLSGVKGALVKGWTITGQLSAGSGLPVTPVYLTSVPGTGFTGTIRPDLTGAPTAAPAGRYLNPDAYAVPPAGQWGNAGRNSMIGPPQFTLNAGVSRSFPWGERWNLDWRIDATNVLNRVTYSSVNAVIGSPQFGLPDRANPMRKVQTSLRLRF
jgi:hypothetical protein